MKIWENLQKAELYGMGAILVAANVYFYLNKDEVTDKIVSAEIRRVLSESAPIDQPTARDFESDLIDRNKLFGLKLETEEDHYVLTSPNHLSIDVDDKHKQLILNVKYDDGTHPEDTHADTIRLGMNDAFYVQVRNVLDTTKAAPCHLESVQYDYPLMNSIGPRLRPE